MKSRPNLPLAVATFVIVLVVGLLALPALGGDPIARAEPAKSITTEPSTRNIRVIDGDTLEDMSADITYRLVNIDTPETGSRARCVAERELGDRATRTVRALITNARAFETYFAIALIYLGLAVLLRWTLNRAGRRLFAGRR